MIPSTRSKGKLPLALGRGQFVFDHTHDCAAGLVERIGQLENRGERGSLLAKLKDADIGAAQVSVKAKLFLRQPRFLAQLTENFPKGDRWLQISLPLLEELSRNGTILSSYSYGNAIKSLNTSKESRVMSTDLNSVTSAAQG